MRSVSRPAAAACLFVAALAAGCASAPPAGKGLHQTPPTLGRYPYSDADVDFMSGMIPHHAQAVVMAGWAPSHGARKDVAILCERIVVGQRDEIALMQTWLRDRGLPVPDATSTRHKMKMNGVEHEMLMPGMLTDEEMAALDRARGPEFDRLFLLGMIKHHQGADRHGRRALEVVRRGPGRNRLQVRQRRPGRSVDRDRSDGKDARGRSTRVNAPLLFFCHSTRFCMMTSQSSSPSAGTRDRRSLGRGPARGVRGRVRERSHDRGTAAGGADRAAGRAAHAARGHAAAATPSAAAAPPQHHRQRRPPRQPPAGQPASAPRRRRGRWTRRPRHSAAATSAAAVRHADRRSRRSSRRPRRRRIRASASRPDGGTPGRPPGT